MQARKLGSDDLIPSFSRRLENATEDQFLDFQRQNIEKRNAFIVSSLFHLNKIGNFKLIYIVVQKINLNIAKFIQDISKTDDFQNVLSKEKANLHNKKVVFEIKTDFQSKVINKIESIEPITIENVDQLLVATKRAAFDQVSSF